MSKIVDERVVEMQFNNASFEANVKTTMTTLDRLKAALKFPKKTDTLKELSVGAKNLTEGVSLSSRAVETLHTKFSALQVMGVTALVNITNQAVNAGKQIANALTLQPIMSGFAEYETQMNAVQTILSNTRSKGTTIDDVNAALDELNTYADQTIYNFTEMTRNIGTFTAAGVGLKKSTQSIKGIANLAAVSGSSSTQASTAMYQLSQALAAGKVSLMDWNSVVNAGMGGEVFQEALKRTSRVMGTGVDAALEEYGTFRESLTKGAWLTADVLTETLAQISGAYTEADLLAQGYTKDQAKEILELAQDATDAATKVKTFSQLIDTAAEALGSGWTQSWEIIIGDFEEARELFTNASNILNGFITESASARNEMLQGWADLGGRASLIQGITNLFNALLSVIRPISEAFNDIFPPVTAQKLYDLTENFRKFTEGLILTETETQQLKNVFTGIFSVIDGLITLIMDAGNAFGTFLDGIDSSNFNLLEMASNLGLYVTNMVNSVKETGIFGGVLQTLANTLSGLFNVITTTLAGGSSQIGQLFSGMGQIVSRVGVILQRTFANIGSGLTNMLGKADLNSLIDVFNSGVFASIAVSMRKWFESFSSSADELTGGFLDKIVDGFNGVAENISSVLDTVQGSLKAWQQNLKAGTLLKIAGAIAILAASLVVLSTIDKEALMNAIGAVSMLFIELSLAMKHLTSMNTSWENLAGVFIMGGLASSVLTLSFALKNLSSLDFDAITRGIYGVAGLMSVMVAAVKIMTAGAGKMVSGAFQLILMAGAIVILANVCKDLGSLDLETISKGLLGVGGLLLSFGIFTRLVDTNGVIKTSVALLITSGALKVLHGVVSDFGSMNLETLGQGLLSIAAIFVEFSAMSRLVSKDVSGNVLKFAAVMYIFSQAIEKFLPSIERIAAIGLEGALVNIITIAGVMEIMMDAFDNVAGDKSANRGVAELGTLAWAFPEIVRATESIANAMEKLGQLNPTQIVTGLIALKVSMELLTGLMKKMPTDVGDTGAMAAGMIAATAALGLIADAINKIGGLGFEGAISSGLAFGLAMEALGNGMDAIQKREGSTVALIAAAVALTILGAAINLMSAPGLVGIGVGLISLAGTFTIVGIAAKILKPLVPTIFKFATSLITLGASFVVLGAGTALLGVGMISLITSLSGAILVLASIDAGAAAKGLVILAAAFAVIYVAAKAFAGMTGTIISVTGSIALLGISCASVALGISLLTAALGALGASGEESIQNIVSGLKALILGVAEMIPEVITQLMTSFKTILLGLLQVIVEVAPQIAEGILQTFTETLTQLSEYAPTIVTFLLDFIINLFNQLTSRVGELVGAISGFLNALFTAIGQAMSGWDKTGLDQAPLIMGGFVALAFGLNAIKSMIPGAMQGALLMAGLIAEIGVIVAAFGALQQIPGLQELINGGGDLLQSIGTAIGQFIGGIVGGFLEGATSTLPAVATSLSQFMMNLTPFIVGASMLKPSMLEGVTTLAECIIALTAANLLDAIGSFLTGGRDLGAFAEQLVPFGEAVAKFSDTVVGIDTEAVTAAAAAGEALAALANSLPTDGGLAGAIFGDATDMDDFGTQLEGFGEALVNFATKVDGLDTEAIATAVAASHQIVELANAIASLKDGGLSAAIFGESTDMETFGADLTAYGEALSGFDDKVVGLDTEAIATAVAASHSLVELASAIAELKNGGFFGDLFGESESMGSFGTNLSTFGSALAQYSTDLSGVDFELIGQSVGKIRDIVNVTQAGVNLGDDAFEKIEKISKLSAALSTYSTDVSAVDFGKIDQSIGTINSLVDAIGDLTGLDTSGIDTFSVAVSKLGEIGTQDITNAFGAIDLSGVGGSLIQSLSTGMSNASSSITDVVQSIMTSCIELLDGQVSSFGSVGEDAGKAYGTGIGDQSRFVANKAKALVNSAKSALTGYYDSFYSAGAFVAKGFANGISSSAYHATIAARAMADAAKSAAQAALDENSPSKVFYGIGAYAGEGFVNALHDYAGASAKAGRDFSESAIDGAKRSISNITDIINSGVDLNPTITPVVDLSDVKAGAAYINGAFGGASSFSFGQAGAIARGLSARSQNGTLSDVVQGISKLRRDIQSMPVNQYNVGGITYDDGTNVANAVRDLIRATRVGRRK